MVVFLGGHMINHIVAIWSLSSDVEVMTALRRIYRAGWVEPGLIGLFVFQIVSGLILLQSRMIQKTDFFGALQTTSGIYLATFLMSHMTAVFVLGRLVLSVDTNDAWAAGLPAGVVADLWNTRLIPHYSLAAFLLGRARRLRSSRHLAGSCVVFDKRQPDNSRHHRPWRLGRDRYHCGDARRTSRGGVMN